MEKNPFVEKRYLATFCYVTVLFLMWGLLHSMSDVLNRHFQNVLQVSRGQSGLIQLSVFGAYFVMSIPAGLFLKRYGYKAGVLLGLGLFAAGVFLFLPAADAASFNYFRIALFIMGCGMATLETVAHPFAAALGNQSTSDQRINFAQSFNAVGTIIGPKLGAVFLLSGAVGLGSVKMLYAGIGGAILLVALAFIMLKVPVLADPHPAADAPTTGVGQKLFGRRHFVWAVASQFFNVAAQAGTWAFFINYGHDVMGFSDEAAAGYMSVFMAMMAAGRFLGTYLMRFIAPNKLLAIFAAGNILMCFIVAQAWGWPSYIALMMINFFFSIMFPTIFSLGLKDLGAQTRNASSYISMGVVGGAFFPLLMGQVANHNVATSYYLPIVCYLVIFLFAVKFYKVR